MSGKIRFIKSAPQPKDYPPPLKPEVALVGRSNAGKSSFLNVLAGQKIARVSQVPGKTRILNFFEFKTSWSLVDMPGYGYAARSRNEIESWGRMMDSYFATRENLRTVVLIMDIRREWQEEEEMVLAICRARELKLIVVLNKSDKLSRSRAIAAQKQLQKEMAEAEVHVVSSLKRTGFDEVEKAVFIGKGKSK